MFVCLVSDVNTFIIMSCGQQSRAAISPGMSLPGPRRTCPDGWIRAPFDVVRNHVVGLGGDVKTRAGLYNTIMTRIVGFTIELGYTLEPKDVYTVMSREILLKHRLMPEQTFAHEYDASDTTIGPNEDWIWQILSVFGIGSEESVASDIVRIAREEQNP
jgi:hypothetical protein